MEVETAELKSTYLEGLKGYLSTQDEVWLSEAFEQSQSALKEGINGLDLIHLHHEILPTVVKENPDLELGSAVQLASTYLTEWMIAYDVKVRSFRRLINQLNEKNEKLESEINQRKQVQERLEESKEHFRSLIENSHDIITVLDEKGNVSYDTPSVYRILGYNQRELVDNNIFTFVHPKDTKEVKEAFQKTIENPGELVSAEFRFQHKNGDWVYLESLAKYVPDTPEGSSVIVNSRDVTSRHQRIRMLNEQRIKLTESQKIAKVGSWEWDINEEDSLIIWSDEVYRIFGLEKEEFQLNFKTYISHVHPDDKNRVEKKFRQSFKNRESFSLQHRIVRGDGELRYVTCRGRTITENSEDEPLKMLGTIQDITEQKERENQLQVYSEKLRELSERIERTREEERTRIAREIHDELGQMLTVLKIDMSLCKEAVKRKVSDRLADYIDNEMQQMMNRVNTIIESVHSITTKLRPEVLDDLEITEAIEWQANELAQRVGLSVELNSSLDITEITDDQKTTLFRIFQEAMNNIVRHAEATRVDINFKKSSGDLLLIIKDDGVGITEKEKNARSSFGIIGMRERARFIGGDIHIESKEGKGTKITVKVPLNDNRDTNKKVE